MMSLNIRKYTGLFLIVILAFTVHLISFKNGHDWGGDFSLYIDQARTLVNGNFDQLIADQGFRSENSTAPVGPVLYSWGFPILLSPVYYFLGLDIHAMKVYVDLFFIFSLIIVFMIFKDDLSSTNNILLVAFIAFNRWFFDFKDAVLSDFTFLFFSLLSIYLIRRFVINKKIWINEIVSYSLLGLSIFLTVYIREIGIFLLPTLLITQYIESRRAKTSLKTFLSTDISKFVPYLLFLIVMVAINLTPLRRSNVGRALYEFSLFDSSQLIISLKYYFFLFSRFFPFLTLKMSVFGLNYNKLSLLIYGIMIALAVFGMIRNLKKDYIYIIYGFITMSFLLIFPSRQGARFVIHLFPFFLYFLFEGISKINIPLKISAPFSNLNLDKAALFGAGLVLISLVYTAQAVYQNIVFNRTNVINGPYSAESTELFNYIKINTEEKDALIFFKPRVLMLYTGRKSFAINSYNLTPDKILNSPAKYIIFNKTKLIPSDLTIEDFQQDVSCEFENDSFIMCDLRKI